ncbi:MAG: hypothetical protein ACJAQT_004005 [Akkermansiaceae bacterium]|jgi:hypothetical protein
MPTDFLKAERRWLAITPIAIIILVIVWFSTHDTLPKIFRIATAHEGSFYHEFGKALRMSLKEKTGCDVVPVQTEASLKDEKLLREGKVDLAIVQGGSAKIKELLRLPPPIRQSHQQDPDEDFVLFASGLNEVFISEWHCVRQCVRGFSSSPKTWVYQHEVERSAAPQTACRSDRVTGRGAWDFRTTDRLQTSITGECLREGLQRRCRNLCYQCGILNVFWCST